MQTFNFFPWLSFSVKSSPFSSLAILQAQSKGFSGPTLGPKIAEKNERGFTEEDIKAGREGHIGMQAGTNKLASQAGDHYGRPRQIAGDSAYN